MMLSATVISSVPTGRWLRAAHRDVGFIVHQRVEHHHLADWFIVGGELGRRNDAIAIADVNRRSLQALKIVAVDFVVVAKKTNSLRRTKN